MRGSQQRGTSRWTHTRLAPACSRWGYLFGAPAKAVEGLERDARHSTSINGIAIMIGGADAAGADICAASVHPENFDRQRLTLEGIAAWIEKGDLHAGTKYMTFLLRSSGLVADQIMRLGICLSRDFRTAIRCKPHTAGGDGRMRLRSAATSQRHRKIRGFVVAVLICTMAGEKMRVAFYPAIPPTQRAP